MPKRKFVSYLRVSTARQGISGLGLEAQRASVAGYLNGGDWTLVQEVLEVESGKRNDRPALAEALKLCRKHKATLVIAKLDRLARNVAFISNLMESGVEFIAVDMPQANRFVVHIMAAVAEQEADAISKRTKAALQAAKERGTKLGGRRMSAKRFAEIAANARKERTARVPKFQDSVFALPWTPRNRWSSAIQFLPGQRLAHHHNSAVDGNCSASYWVQRHPAGHHA
jgi:DNA invertase Pin-like site-specific DNA recombinase